MTILLGACLPLAACGGSEKDGGAAPAAAKDVTIDIASFKYLPPKVRVAPGATITWVNKDKAPHTSTSTEEGAFDTGRLGLDERGEVTAPEKPGTYRYFCVFHRFMEADVEVVAAD